MGRPGRDLRAILGVAALMLAAVGCGAGVAAVALLPLFTFQFVDEKDPTHEFSFDPQQPTEISGNLTGTETFKGAFSDLAGTYSGRNLGHDHRVPDRHERDRLPALQPEGELVDDAPTTDEVGRGRSAAARAHKTRSVTWPPMTSAGGASCWA